MTTFWTSDRANGPKRLIAHQILPAWPKGKNKGKTLAFLTYLFLLFLFVFPDTALAVQVHGPPEGVIVHLMGHIFFSVALLFLIYILNKYPVDSSKAWKYFKISIFFWLVWNLDTFVEHILALRLDKSAIIVGKHHIFSYLAGPLTMERWIYYMGQFDHFLCVPAMWSLSMSLRHFCKRVEKQKAEENHGSQAI